MFEFITNDLQELMVFIGFNIAVVVPLTIFMYKNKSQGEQNHKCIERLENKADKHETNVEQMKLAIDRKIDKLSLAVTAIQENVVESKDIHKELKEETKDLKQFVIDWNQRIEDLLRDQRVGGLNMSITKSSTIDRLDTIEKILMKLVEKNEKDGFS